MNRTTKHILHDRLVRKLKRDYRILRTSLAMQASFPDSGYFYSKIERKCEWALEKLEIVLRKDKFKKYIDFLEKHCDRLSWEYYEKVQVVDKNGREWTDYEMDAAMAMQ